MAKYDVGYGKPPKATRFAKGKSGNPRGRPKKKPVDHSLSAILKRVGEQEVEVPGGKMLTLHELEIMALQKKAVTGDVAASRHLAKLREQAHVMAMAERKGGGGYPVPMAIDTETWGIIAARQQAKFRDDPNWEFKPDNLVLDPDATEPGLAKGDFKTVS